VSDATAARVWSDEQNAIYGWFRSGSGNLVVRARAGTGKSTTNEEAVGRAPERSILVAAFNKAIATDAESRMRARRLAHVDVRTLHGLGFRCVQQSLSVRVDADGRRETELAMRGIGPSAGSAPQQVVRLVAKLCTKAREVDPWIATDEPPDAVRKLVDAAARFDLMPDDALEARGFTVEKIAEHAFAAMRAAMERTSTIDFADMIFLPLVHGLVRPRYEMVIVDEAQDMTAAQLAIAVGSCRRDGRVCLLGDDRQNLYSFRGTTHDGIDRLKAELKAAELGLTRTYRCPKAVVALAAEIVPDYRAAPTAPDGEVASMPYDRAIAGVAPGDFVLSRKNAPLVRACMTLLKRGVRARIKGRDVGRGIVALIQSLGADNIDDLESKLSAWTIKETRRADKRLGPDAAAERVAFVMDQAAIVRAFADGADSIRDIERRCEEMFADDAGSAAVTCSTVHRAKGLEADNVYLLRDTFRFDGTLDEQNVLYVAITRARRRLVWVDGEAS
jgi:DNA helicase II / ATP-dependent DNA helicase PcrA